MSENYFTFLIGSPVDKENLICEIYYKDEMLAEISHESQEFVIEIFPSEINKWWTFPLLQFQEAVEHAKNHLLGKND